MSLNIPSHVSGYDEHAPTLRGVAIALSYMRHADLETLADYIETARRNGAKETSRRVTGVSLGNATRAILLNTKPAPTPAGG